MSKSNDYVEHKSEGPTMVSHKEVRVIRSSSATGWLVAAAVAIVAAAGAFIFMSQTSQSDLQAARDQGAIQAQADATASNAQLAASQAAQSAQSAATSTAQAADRAAQATAERAASATDTARDAAANEAAKTPPPQ